MTHYLGPHRDSERVDSRPRRAQGGAGGDGQAHEAGERCGVLAGDPQVRPAAGRVKSAAIGGRHATTTVRFRSRARPAARCKPAAPCGRAAQIDYLAGGAGPRYSGSQDLLQEMLATLASLEERRDRMKAAMVANQIST